MNLDDDLQDFIALIPVDQVESIVLDYITNDEETIEVINWIQTAEEAKSLVYKIEALDTFVDFIAFLEETGLHANEIINQLHQFMGLHPWNPPSRLYRQARAAALIRPSGLRRGTGLSGLVDDIIAILPIDDLHDLFLYKQANSPEFQEMVKRVQSPEFQAMVKHLYEIPEFTQVLDRLREQGIDIDKYIELLRNLFGVDG